MKEILPFVTKWMLPYFGILAITRNAALNMDILNICCRQILYQLSHQRSMRILEWVADPSPADLPDPAIKPISPTFQAGSLPAELPGKPLYPFGLVFLFPLDEFSEMELLNHVVVLFLSF